MKKKAKARRTIGAEGKIFNHRERHSSDGVGGRGGAARGMGINFMQNGLINEVKFQSKTEEELSPGARHRLIQYNQAEYFPFSVKLNSY